MGYKGTRHVVLVNNYMKGINPDSKGVGLSSGQSSKVKDCTDNCSTEIDKFKC